MDVRQVVQALNTVLINPKQLVELPRSRAKIDLNPPAKKLKGGGGKLPSLSPENMVDWYVFNLSSNTFPFLIIRKPNTARSHSPLLQLLRRPQTNPSHGTTPPHREATECHCNRSDASPGRGQSSRRPSSRSSSTSIDDTLIEASPVAHDRQPSVGN